MAINYLNSIDLNRNELQDAQLIRAQVENQPNDASAGTGEEGQLYYDTTLDVLKVWAGGSWSEVGGGVETLTTTDGTYIDLTPNSVVAGPVTVTADLSAVDGTAAASERYLTKNNKWAEISTIPGTYSWNIQGDTGGPTAVASGGTIDIAGGTNVATALSGNTLTINATNDNDYLTGLSFDTNDGILTATVQNQSDVTVDLDGRYLTGNETITLSGEVTGSGTTSISTTVANNVLDVANFNASAIVTVAEGIENNDNDTTLPTSAAVKAYVDSSVVGGLVYQGGYNAATNTPDLDTSPSTSIKKGWTYTVTADGLFFTEQVRVGDVIIAETNAPTALADWTTVQNNIDLADASTIGIGNVNIETAANLLGLSLSYSSGTAKLGLDIGSLTLNDGGGEGLSDLYIPFLNDPDGQNYKINTADLLSLNSFSATISASGAVTHSLGTKDVIVQLYDIVTDETVYADVDRNSTSQVTVTFSSTPTNSVRVLVQKIG